MNPFRILKEEHEIIERDLFEIETIIKTNPINHSNLLHTFKKLSAFWNQHEDKEDKIFMLLQDAGYKIPAKIITFEHTELRRLKDSILNSLETDSEDKKRDILNNNGAKLIKKLRDHMEREDFLLYSLPINEMPPIIKEKLETLASNL